MCSAATILMNGSINNLLEFRFTFGDCLKPPLFISVIRHNWSSANYKPAAVSSFTRSILCTGTTLLNIRRVPGTTHTEIHFPVLRILSRLAKALQQFHCRKPPVVVEPFSGNIEDAVWSFLLRLCTLKQ